MSESLLLFENKGVLVVGDIMLDRYFWGHVDRISPEAPVPVVRMERTTETLGGAGNVANNLAGLGCPVTVIGICGKDQTARSLEALLSRKGIGIRLVEDDARPTITKTRIMAGKQQVLRLDEELADTPDGPIFEQVMQAVSQSLPDAAAVILSDYGKGIFSTGDLAQEIIQAAKAAHIPVLVDPKGTQWERYAGATCITPNTAELEAWAGLRFGRDEPLMVSQAVAVRRRLSLASILVTRGAKGMCLISDDDQPFSILSRAREVYDVSGAGDTVIATVAASLACGLPIARAAEIANQAAGIVVGKLGTQPVLKSELDTAMRYGDPECYHPSAAAKMAALDAALAKVQEWKAAGDAVVFTNGCFDLLHPGHISLLYRARSLGARLVVGLNTDASVRRLKGPERPILSEQDRAAMLSALECVDIVVHFDEDTPLELIRKLQPDVLVKGSDYRPEEVVGKQAVESYGGRVELVELVKGYSTTQITHKVRAGKPSGKP